MANVDTWAHPVARSLISTTYTNLNNGSIIIPEDDCFCKAWLQSFGSVTAKKMANALQWAAFAFSVAILLYYAYATWKTTCGWEEVYVCCVELTKVIIEFFHELDEPAMLYLGNGNRVLWLRYGEWLLTCPVILIHLSNLTGLKDDYNKRTMRLLVSDIGTIVWGATAAMSTGYVKVVFFLLGCLYGANTFFHAAKVYIESFHTVPKGLCRQLVRVMAWVFFVSWGMFPVLFLLGPEGFKHLSVYGSTIGHTFIDLMSKNVWGLLGHFLRLKIHEHILLYGDIRKVQKIKVAGQELEVETMMAEEDEDTVKKPTAQYANRESFLNMRDKLKEKGYEVRASLEASSGDIPGLSGDGAAKHRGPAPKGGAGGGAAAAALEMSKAAMDINEAILPGRVILAVPDISMVDYFREQFAQLPVPYEVVPSLGVENTVQLVLQANTLGGCDFVLLHPEFLRDKSAPGLPNRLRTMGQRIAAFGWAPMGPVRDLIESSGLDGWLEGPSFGSGINLTQLTALVVRMQQARKLAAMMGMGMGMGAAGGGMAAAGGMMSAAGSMAASNMGLGGAAMNGMGSVSTMGGGAGNGISNMSAANLGGGLSMSMGGGSAPSGLMSQLSSNGRSGIMPPASPVGGAMGMGGMMAGNGQQQMNALNSMAGQSFQVGSNPLFNAAPSPLSSQPGGDGMPNGSMPNGSMANGMAAMQPAGSIRNSGLMGAGMAPMQMGVLGGGGVAQGGPMAIGSATLGGGGGALGGGGATEAEMLQQLMAEINRLKNELGE